MAAILARSKCSVGEISFDNLEMADNFGLSVQERTGYTFPMSVSYLTEMQEQDKKAMRDIKKDNHKYELKKIERALILTRDGNMFIPTSLWKYVVAWYHGMWPGLAKDVQAHCKKCNVCQIHKKNRKQYGKIPAKLAKARPWEIVCVDLVATTCHSSADSESITNTTSNKTLSCQVDIKYLYHQDDAPSAPLSPPEMHRALATTTPHTALPIISRTKTTLPDPDEN
jgi:hypothetical protein